MYIDSPKAGIGMLCFPNSMDKEFGATMINFYIKLVDHGTEFENSGKKKKRNTCFEEMQAYH